MSNPTPSPTSLNVEVNPPDPWLIVVRMVEIVNYILKFLPNLAISIAILIFFIIIGKIFSFYVGKAMKRSKFTEYAIFVWCGVARWAWYVLGFLVALLVLFPGFGMSDLIAFVGVFSIALGLVFKDLITNIIAGMSIILSRPFNLGDHIEGGGVSGVVGNISTRCTTLNQADGTIIYVPNSILYFSVLKVNTRNKWRRGEYTVGIGYEEDIDTAKEVCIEAAKKAPGVITDDPDHPVEAGCTDLGDSAVSIRVRWWTLSDGGSYWGSYAAVQLIKDALVEKGIDIPYPVRTVYHHDMPMKKDAKLD